MLEIVFVMRRIVGTISEYERSLTASSGTATPLRIVGRIRGDIAHMNCVKCSNVDAQFHCRRTEKSANLTSPEFLFSFYSLVRVQLSSMLCAMDALTNVMIVRVEFLEIDIWLRWKQFVGSVSNGINTYRLAIT